MEYQGEAVKDCYVELTEGAKKLLKRKTGKVELELPNSKCWENLKKGVDPVDFSNQCRKRSDSSDW